MRAKRSNPSCRGGKVRKYGLLRFARNDGALVSHTTSSSPRGALEALLLAPAHRGRGECRMPNARAASCATCIGRTHTSNNEYTGITRHSRTQWFYGLFRALPGDRLFCHRRLRTSVLSTPGRADTTSANLTPASGRQDHTTSPYAASSLVRVLLTAHGLITRPAIPSHARRCRVHRIPCPTSVTIAKRPSVWDRNTSRLRYYLSYISVSYRTAPSLVSWKCHGQN